MTKRRRSGGPTYAIDSSTWIALEGRPDLEMVWATFTVLIKERRLITAPEILKELKHPDYKDVSVIYRLIKPFESDISFRRLRDQQFHDILGDLHHNFPQLCRTRHPKKRPADPYLIATAKRCGFIVVSEETLQKRPSRKIPHACVHGGVKCYTVDELLAKERTLFT